MKRIRETCLECGEPIPKSNRIDSKFCDPSCKARYWRKKKEYGSIQGISNKIQQQKEDKPAPTTASPLEGLRGVIDNTITTDRKDMSQKPYYPVQACITEDTQVETKEYCEAMAERARIEVWGNRVLSDLAGCENSINRELENIKQHSSVKPALSNYLRSRKKSIDRDDLFWEEDLLTELQKVVPSNQYQVESCKQRVQSMEERKKMLLKELDEANKAMNIVMNRLKSIPQFRVKQKPQFNIADLLKAVETKKLKEQNCGYQYEITPNDMKENESNVAEIETNDRVISSNQLLKIDYKSLNFQGRWKDFLGQPAVIFHTAVHGLPGGGKSTFCLQYSDYLAKNFGKVIYICGEERFSKTLQEKLQRLGIKNPYLFFHDARNYEDIRQYILPTDFHFIVIDSLDTLKIDAVKLKELKEHYPQSAFITISQSRKDGKMKGDNEILHDADAVIGVYKGIATTSKNRFNDSDRQFEVFLKAK